MLEHIETAYVNQVTVAVTECLKHFKGKHDLVWLIASAHHSRKSMDSQSHRLLTAKKPIKDKTHSTALLPPTRHTFTVPTTSY